MEYSSKLFALDYNTSNVRERRTKKKRRGIERKKENASCAFVKNPMKNSNFDRDVIFSYSFFFSICSENFNLIPARYKNHVFFTYSNAV